jgi:hypothetical protein
MVNTACYPAAGGTITGGGIVNLGTNVTVTATANPGYSFASWMEDGTVVSTSASYSFAPVSSCNLVAFFSPITTISIGTTVMSRGGFTLPFTYAPGAHCSVLCTTNLALPLTNWTVLGTATESSPGQYEFTDPQAGSSGERFYIIRSP